jgi:hypothetical protein
LEKSLHFYEAQKKSGYIYVTTAVKLLIVHLHGVDKDLPITFPADPSVKRVAKSGGALNYGAKIPVKNNGV